MNRIVKRHVPVSELPAELREGLDPDALATVEVTLEERPTLESILARRRDTFGSSEEIDEHVRALRAEWAHRDP